jgi:methyl-accepting chemotaxis protein
MKFLDSLKVRYKLLGILGVIILGFFLIALVYKVERDTETEMQRLEQQADQTNTLLYQIQVEVLQARHHEKDFLLRGQDNSLDQHRQTLAAFQTDIQRLQALTESDEQRRLVEQVEAHMRTYEERFRSLVEAMVALGLSENSGQLGELNTAARDMESVFRQYGDSAKELTNSLLMMRRHEKDYLARKQEEQINKMAAERTRFELLVEDSHLLPDDKEAVVPRMADYQGIFAKMVESIAVADRETAAFQEAAHSIDPLLVALRQQWDQTLAQGKALIQAQRTNNAHLFFGIILGIGFIVALALLLVARSITRPLGGEPVEMEAITGRIAHGDLTMPFANIGKETGVYAAMRDMATRLQNMVGQIMRATGHVHTAAVEIAQGSSDLAQRTQKQASALEETASSMEELTSTVRHSADQAGAAHLLAVAARTQAERGGQVVEQAVVAMGAISASSYQITHILAVIDEIAFQTNLLALNAAVEAARVGEQGRGFAVVASEVRNLAQRSAVAAKEIKSLIQDSIAKMDEGARLVNASGAALNEIVTATKKVHDIVADMAAAAREQALGIEQVSAAILQIDQVTQQNAALVEQTATASQGIGEQARQLNELMTFFQLGDQQSLADAATVNTQNIAREDSARSPVEPHARHRHHHRAGASPRRENRYPIPTTVKWEV